MQAAGRRRRPESVAVASSVLSPPTPSSSAVAAGAANELGKQQIAATLFGEIYSRFSASQPLLLEGHMKCRVAV